MKKSHSLAIALLALIPVFATAEDAKAPDSATDLKLFDKADSWKFGIGKPSGTGSFAVGKDGDTPIGTVTYDFSKGGDYVQIASETELPEGTTEFHLRARSADFGHRVTVRFIDDTDQTLQYKVPIKSGDWVNIKIPLSKKAEHWGGANDGKFHFPTKKIILIVPAPAGETKAGKMDFADAAIVKK